MKTNHQIQNESKSAVPSKGATKKQALPAELNRAVKKAVNILTRLTGRDVEDRYELGVVVRDAMDSGKYGDKALAAFVDELQLDADTLRAHAMVTRIWHEKEFKQLAAQRGGPQQTYRLSWAHFVLLAGEKDGRVRRGLITTAFEQQLSEKKLRIERSGAAATPKRNVSADTNPSEVVTAPVSVLDAAREWVSKGEQLNSILDASMEVVADIGQLMAAEHALVQLERLLADVRDRLARARAKAETTESPQLKPELALVQGAQHRALQAPIPFNPTPETSSQAVSAGVQGPVALEAPIPYLPGRVNSEASEPQP